MVEQIAQYSQHIRHETAYSRGEGDDRMVDALAHEDWLTKASGAEVVAFCEGVRAGTNSEHKEMPDMNPDDQPLDLMYKKGKGRGKGKRGPPPREQRGLRQAIPRHRCRQGSRRKASVQVLSHQGTR